MLTPPAAWRGCWSRCPTRWIPEPLWIPAGSSNGSPLLLGSFVNVALVANTLENVYPVPDKALREGDQVHVVDQDGRLAVKNVTIAFRTNNTAYIQSGLDPGDRSSCPGFLRRSRA